jgi:uncharacterized lipoprotein YajG
MQTKALPITLFIFLYCVGFAGCDGQPQGQTQTLPAASAAQEPRQNTSQLPEVSAEKRTQVSNDIITNLEAPIPSQCYTKTENRHNP